MPCPGSDPGAGRIWAAYDKLGVIRRLAGRTCRLRRRPAGAKPDASDGAATSTGLLPDVSSRSGPSVFRQVFSDKCFPTSVFRQVFSDKCFQSVMRMFRTDARPRDTDV